MLSILKQLCLDTKALRCVTKIACNRCQNMRVTTDDGCIQAMIAIDHGPPRIITQTRNPNINLNGVSPSMLHEPSDSLCMRIEVPVVFIWDWLRTKIVGGDR